MDADLALLGFNYTWICINLNNNGPCTDVSSSKIIIPKKKSFLIRAKSLTPYAAY
jgi:hypothetical protein